MGPESVILEISSDEEDAGGVGKSGKISLDWLSEMLQCDDELWGSDDVVVVEELSCAAEKQGSAHLGTGKGSPVSESDDDCEVLDGDPDKPVEVAQDKGDGSDDLLIVGEKGQLACRDYPHPRHLCATFPFSTTLHEKHCKLCHCYVCDSLAPCIYWGSGASIADHCHSTDKEEMWKVQRKSFKRGNAVVAHLQKHPDATLSIRPPVTSSLPFSLSSHGQGSISLRAPISGSKTMCACSANRFSTYNVTSQKHSHQPSIIRSSQRHPQRVHRSHALFCGTHVVSTRPAFKRSGAALPTASVNRSGYSVSNHSQVCSNSLQRNQHLPVASMDENLKKWQDVLFGLDSDPVTADPVTEFQQFTTYPQPEVCGHSFTRTGVNQTVDVFGSSAPVTTDPKSSLDDRWSSDNSLSSAGHVSSGYPQQPNVQACNLHTVSQNNPVSVDTPCVDWLNILEHEPDPAAANDHGLFEFDALMSGNDDEGIWSNYVA